MTYNPNTYGYYQCDEEDYNSNDSPEEQAESLAAHNQRKETLLAEYRAGMAQADQHWSEYLKTDSQQAFSNYLAINRSLSAVYTELVAYGMTLDEIKQQSDGGAFDANLD